MANRVGGVPFTPKMNIFYAEVGSNQKLITLAEAQDGAVVANALDHGPVRRFGRQAANARNQLSFCQYQSRLTISNKRV